MKKNIYLLSLALLLVISCKNGLNDNVNLKELKLQNFVLHPAFTPLRTEYEATSSKFEYKIQVTAYPEDENAIVNIEYLYNQINILVTSSSGKSKRKYVVKLQTFSLYDLGLTSLSLFSASKEIPFTNEFSKQKTNYEALIPFSFNTELDVIYKIEYPLAKVEIKKEPSILGAMVGSRQVITISITEPKYGLSKQYVIKCVRQSLNENTNIDYVSVLNKKAYYLKDGFHSLVPFKMNQKEIEKNIIVKPESFLSNVLVSEVDSTPLSNAEGAKKNYSITITAEDTSKTKNYTLVLERGKHLDVKVESVSVKDIMATKKTSDNFFLFLPENIEATKIENDVNLTFEGGKEYSYTVKAINQKPLGLSPLSFKEFQVLIYLGDEVEIVNLTVFRDLVKKEDRELVEVIKEDLNFTGKTPIWLDSSNPDYKDLIGAFKEGKAISIKPFSIGKYEVTYQLWKGVYDWATAHNYYFENKGKCGSSNSGDARQPVSDVAWRDVIVWCNAYSEMLGKEPIYYSDSECRKVIKTSITSFENNEKHIKSAGSIDMPYMKHEADGFRLPFSNEWELASRGGDPTNSLHWNFKYAGSNELEEVAVFFPKEAKNKSTAIVGSKLENRLNLYDMSGNVFEWCADTLSDGTNYYKAQRGGAFYSQAISNCVTFSGVAGSWQHYNNRGFRVATSIK
jgi:hypothetical protein